MIFDILPHLSRTLAGLEAGKEGEDVKGRRLN